MNGRFYATILWGGEMNFGERIKYLRTKKGLTQKELADKMGVSSSWIGMYESGRRKPKLGTLRKIATALEVDVSSLYSYVDTDDPDVFILRFDKENFQCYTTPVKDAVTHIKVEVDLKESEMEEGGEGFPIDPEMKNQWVLDMIPKTAKEYHVPKELLMENRPIYTLSIEEQCKQGGVYLEDLPEILKRIVSVLEKMNLEGQRTAIRCLQELSEISRYQIKKF